MDMFQTAFKDTKLNLAYVSPFNPISSGISDYSETLVPALSDFFHITLYSDCGEPSTPHIARGVEVRSTQLLPRYATQHDLCLYQIGNSAHHQTAFNSFRRLPGVVTLHEPFLHHGFYAASMLRYRREVFYEIGRADESEVKRLASLTVQGDCTKLLPIPLIGRLLDASLGIVVHSDSARQMVQNYRPVRAYQQRRSARVVVIPQPMPVLDVYDKVEGRKALDFSREALIFGVAGKVQPLKEPRLILRAFAEAVSALTHARLVFVGERPNGCGITGLAKELDVVDHVDFLGRVDPLDRLHQAMAACDVLINLRRPTIGETSGTALRAMALGRPIIVRDVGWYGELPDRACVKIGPEAGVDALSSAMVKLGASSDARRRIGVEARRYIREKCDVATVARRYAEFLWDTHRRIVTRAGDL